jgi:hypothetical protein
MANRREINIREIESAVEGARLQLRQILIQPGDSPELAASWNLLD